MASYSSKERNHESKISAERWLSYHHLRKIRDTRREFSGLNKLNELVWSMDW
jgi:hypothetical protein